MPVDLSSADQIPAPLKSSLSRFLKAFTDVDCLDTILEIEGVASLQGKLNYYAEEQGIIGFHFTRADPARIRAHGLAVQSGASARARFMRDYGSRLSAEQTKKIESGWQGYFSSRADKSRDGKLWFNLTRLSIDKNVSNPLLEYYGGEIVHMPFRHCPDLAPIFKAIGKPLVVCCALKPRDLETFKSFPWGRIWISAFHASVNKSALQADLDVYMTHSLPPARILKIMHPESDTAFSGFNDEIDLNYRG